MTAANYDACISKVLEYEGGYQNDPNDSGNWTGCKPGAGENKGTNRGITACTYPKEDIVNMTEVRAKEIYNSDFWNPIQGDRLPAGVDLCTFDGSVNSGRARGVAWLQHAVGVDADGIVGPVTIQAVLIADDHVTIDRMCDDRMAFLRSLSTWDLYGKGWTARVEDVRAEAHDMVIEDVEPEPQPDELVVTIKIDVPAGVVVKIEQTEH
jgi:lysozyme family protein